jgi:hypothetical protein
MDPKDMILIKSPTEIPIGGAFYRKEPDGSFARVVMDKDDPNLEIMKMLTTKFCLEGRLYKSRIKSFRRY